MAHDQYESPLCGRYSSKKMQRLFSDDHKFAGWREVWYKMASAQQAQGAPISDEQLSEMVGHIFDPIEYDKVAELEKELRHDVIAHATEFGRVCPTAAPIINLGGTSCDTTDNVDLHIMRKALGFIEAGLARVIDRLARFAKQYRSLPVLGSTHYQAAALTTVGKRACMWAQNFLMDLQFLEWVRGSLRFRGLKGATGTQASFLELFEGDHGKVLAAEKQFAAAFGFSDVFTITGQTYPRKVDSRILGVLGSIALSASKMATDIRLLAHDKEMDEPFEKGQKGSFGMPFKKNAMRDERACSLSRIPMVMEWAAQVTEAIQWLERSLDDSAARRIYVSESFLAVDAILRIVQNVTEGLVVYPKVIEGRIGKELPFMAIEKFLVAMIKAGADRFECHEKLRVHSMAAAGVVKNEGGNNDLLDRLRADDYFRPIHGILDSLLDPASFIGRAPEQVNEFLENEVGPALARFKDVLGGTAELSV
ncbi:MAG: adenylosuccinate lyase [Candidatus Komeilibacteria bacterium]|nr:adenylosuccinate lyase [Candidatus Komeilibacteria bacterium]